MPTPGGTATARLLANNGVRVAVVDRDEERGAAVAEDIDGISCAADITDQASVDAAFARGLV